MNATKKRLTNSTRRKGNRAIYRTEGGCARLKATSGVWRIQSGMNNINKWKKV